MEVMNFSNLESQVLSSFNEGNKTFESLLKEMQINEKTLNDILETLISKNILSLNKQSKQFEYQSKVDGDLIILDGNILLPTTIIRLKDKMLICRGEWYEFPLDFDMRRIIWNVKLENKTNSTLVDLIQSSVLKVKKSKLIQLPEYNSLKNKIVPYSDKIGLFINCVGEEITDVFILFKIMLDPKSDMSTEHRDFKVQSEISTKELISELKKPVDERNFIENLKINKIFNFSDFIFSKNEIPVTLANGKLTYIVISGIRKKFELSYFEIDKFGNKKKLSVDSYDDNNEAIEKLRDIFNGLPSVILSENNFLCEMTE